MHTIHVHLNDFNIDRSSPAYDFEGRFEHWHVDWLLDYIWPQNWQRPVSTLIGRLDGDLA